MNSRRTLGIAGLLLAVGMAIGASGAHALRTVLAERQLQSLDTAVDYQLINALGLLLLGVLMRGGEEQPLPRIANVLLAGILCFSGGIYLMIAGAPWPFAFITPAGGVLLITGWVWFGVAMLRRRRTAG